MKALDAIWAASPPAGDVVAIQLSEGGDPVRIAQDLSAGAAWSLREGLEELLRPALALDLVTIESPVSNGGVSVCLRPGSACGFATVRVSGRRIHLACEPKIKGAEYLDLLWLSAGADAPILKESAETSASPNRSLLERLANAYTAAVASLLSAGLSPLHVSVEEDLRCAVKGKLLVAKYLAQIAKARPQFVPCRFPAHDVDNLVNRAIRWALRLLLVACHDAPLAAGLHRTVADLNALDARLAGVSLTPVGRSQLSRHRRLPEAFARYRATGVLPLAELILERLHLGRLMGDHAETALAFSPPDLFEKAFAAFMAKRDQRAITDIYHLEWPIEAGVAGGPVKRGRMLPDIVLPPEDQYACLVADTKWKTAVSKAVNPGSGSGGDTCLEVRGIQLKNEDFYQVMTYARVAEARFPGKRVVAALVYPVVDANEADLDPIPVRVVPASAGAKEDASLYLVPWEVGSKCMASLPRLWERLQTLRQPLH